MAQNLGGRKYGIAGTGYSKYNLYYRMIMTTDISVVHEFSI
jgi:hypothetical protein